MVLPKIYQLYLSANLILPFLMGTFFFVSFLMTFEMIRILSLVSLETIEPAFLIGLMADVALTLTPIAIPMALFFSTVFSVSRLSSDSEYIALRAAGINKKGVYLPFLLVAFIVALNSYFLSQNLIPGAHARVRKKIKILTSTSLIEGIKSGQFFTRFPGMTLFPRELDDNKKMVDVFLSSTDPKEKTEKVIWARSGKILHEKNEKTGVESLSLWLKDGNMVTIQSGEKENLEKVIFDEYTLPIREQKFSYRTTTKEIMMNTKQLNRFIAEGIEGAIKKGYKEKDYYNARYEYWNRWNNTLLCLILGLVGFTLGVGSNRGRSKNPTAKAILVLIAYFMVFFALVSGARSGSYPAWLAIGIADVALLGFGLFNFKKIDWMA